MVNAVFTDEMIEILRTMKGKTLKSYECESGERWNHPYGCVRLNLGEYAVDLTNEVHDLEFFGRIEDIPYFECEKKELSDPFRWNKKTEAYMVDEKIKEVVIVTDEIDIPLEKYSIVTNRAVILRCEYNYYVFDREWYYGELIFIKIGKTMPELYSTEKVAYDWGDDGKNETIVKRTMTTL